MKLLFFKPLFLFFVYSTFRCVKIENYNFSSLNTEKDIEETNISIKSDSITSLPINNTINSENEYTDLELKTINLLKSKKSRKLHSGKNRNHYLEAKNEESLMEISVYFFVPLVIFIIIATVSSIAGFIYLLVMFSISTNTLEEKTRTNNIEHLNDIISILILRNQIKKNKKKEKNTNNYKSEPESEGKVLNLYG